ncbi:unnamed protein product [Owenia fusiformis]|uniref:Phosphatidylinositol transfer protein N-terminal domain-containing protein n=1 Tax=Owenia fusiformis TaxID=6347 RepID=A0A8J1T766_OWEFU|nr:unnamed protein product [Owenia fusiformis]
MERLHLLGYLTLYIMAFMPMTSCDQLREYRIELPFGVDEFQVGHLYSVAMASMLETGGGEGFEIIVNEPVDRLMDKESRARVFRPTEPAVHTDGQYTHKLLQLASKVPNFVRLLAPTGSLEAHEKSWNFYPVTRTEYSNVYMREHFYEIVETVYLPGRCENENVFGLEGEELEKRVVDVIKITEDPVDSRDYKESEDPLKCISKITGRLPLKADWMNDANSVMCAYKLVSYRFNWWGLQTKVEALLVKATRRVLQNLHRQAVCWLDEWYGMPMAELRLFEKLTKEELDKMRNQGDVKGMKEV